ncbi:MAG: Gldg family protein [Planctomycetota bacterium]|nr:Gldg family protein [Planctomycetota bacterium]
MRAHKKQRYGLFINLVLIAAVLGIINFIATDYFIRFDLTENQSYSVTKATKNILRGLDDIVSIKVYCSKKLPPQLEHIAREIKDAVQEYKAYARGNLQIEWIDPAEDKETEEKVRGLGIPQLQANIIEKDKQQVVNIYLGIGIFHSDRKEIIPAVREVSNLEYELSSAIFKVKTGQLKKIYFLTGHNERDINKEYSTLRRALEKNYEVATVDTSKDTPIPQDVDTLIVASPNELSERDKYEIDQFLMKDKNIFFLIDTVNVTPEVFMPMVRKHNLEDMLEHYGVKIKKNLVLDGRSHSVVQFSQQFFTFATNYPLWPKVVRENMARDNSIVNRLETVAFPWVGSVEIIKDRVTGMEAIELLKTTPQSWTQEDNYNIDYQRLAGPQTGEFKQHTLAALVRGKFKSFFAEKPIPPPKSTLDTTSSVEVNKERQTIKECSKGGTILVVGDSDFITDNLLGGREGNLSFILNACDWATLGGDLIGIRAKETAFKPLKEISPPSRLFCKIVNIGLVPCLFIIYGLLRYLWRQREKKVVEEIV